ncbi:MAG TPA: transglutaminase domain-containing protein, partial [Blastocatellia bacterium]|nr:transglutaminase domain-containing protein [Blastocatellia bacterium]
RNLGFSEGEADADREFKSNNSADETIRRRYGTPREINRLFIAMLRAAGLDARVGELTTRDENFFYRSFPDSFQLNGEVTAVIAPDGSIMFYDPGTPFCPLGMLSWEKEAVTALVLDQRDLRFVETPVTRAGRSNQDRRFQVMPFADGRVDVRVETRVGGQRALEFRNEMVDLLPADQRKRFVDPVRALLPTAIIDESKVSISNLTNPAAPVEASYSFTVPQFASRAGSRLLLRPAMLAHPDESRFPAPRRSNSIYFRYPWSESERMTIESPEGYEVEQLPDPVEIDIGAASYRAVFSREGRRVIYERRLDVNAITFTVAQYPTVKDFFDRVHQADRALISFKQ